MNNWEISSRLDLLEQDESETDRMVNKSADGEANTRHDTQWNGNACDISWMWVSLYVLGLEIFSMFLTVRYAVKRRKQLWALTAAQRSEDLQWM